MIKFYKDINWVLMGAFSQQKTVFVFTDEARSYEHAFGILPRKVLIADTQTASFFDFNDALSQWGDF